MLPVYKSQEDWEEDANAWRGSGGPIHIRRPKDPHPTAPAFLDVAREMGMPILDNVNRSMVPGAGYINMNISADETRESAVGAFLRPALSRPNLTLLAQRQRGETELQRQSLRGLSSGPSGDTDINLVLEQLPAVTPEAVARFGGSGERVHDRAGSCAANEPVAVRLASNKFQDAAGTDGNYVGTD